MPLLTSRPKPANPRPCPISCATTLVKSYVPDGAGVLPKCQLLKLLLKLA